MTTAIIKTAFEIIVASIIIWGLFNEQKLIDFEDKIFKKMKARNKK